MGVTAYLEAARVLRIETPRQFALLTLERLLAEAWDGGTELQHVIAYGKQHGISTEKIPGTLDDYAMTIHACIDGWLGSGEMRYYGAAIKLADAMIARFYDRSGGAFFDTATANGSIPLGALTARRKPLQDSPTPAGNPSAASALMRLEELSGRIQYREIGENTLESFAGIAEHYGLYAGSYGLALERLLLDPMQIVIVGEGVEADQLEAAAVARFAVNKTVVRLSKDRLTPESLPEALGETLLQVPHPEGSAAWALVCRSRSCLPPVTTGEALLEALS